MADGKIDPRDWEAVHEAARGSLAVFTQIAWPELNRGTPLVFSWHNEAICEHLEAVSSGQIKRLIINIPPGMSKTTHVCQTWPVWEWLHAPHRRWGFTAYGGALTLRDSRRRRDLMTSQWYRKSFAPTWQLKGDANTVITVANTETGEMQATSVGGPVTGFHFDRLVCFPGDQLVWTEHGRIPIGEIVRRRMDVRVWSTNVETGETSLQPITGWVENPGDEIVEVCLRDGTAFRCTPSHRIWTDRGWVEASRLLPADVLPRPSVPNGADGCRGDAEPAGEVDVGLCAGEDRVHLRLAKSGLRCIGPDCVVVGAPVPGGDVDPGPAPANQADRGLAHVEATSQFRCCVVTLRDGDDVCARELRRRAPIVERECPMPFRVGRVLRACPVGEIRETRVSGVTVQVPDLVGRSGRTDECQHDEAVDRPDADDAVDGKAHVRVPVVDDRDEKPSNKRPDVALAIVPHRPVLAPDSAEAGYEVPTKARDRSPVLVRRVGFAAETFCLSVAHNHTFTVGSNNGTTVSNCDDPIKAEEVYTKALRSHVEWFNGTWTSRRRDKQDSAMVIIMQRLHDKDLAGVKLAEGGWDHLNLPMEYDPKRRCVTSIGWSDPRTQEGEPLCPERVTPATIADEKRRPAIWSAQYQQSPRVGDGTIWKERWMLFYYLDEPIEGAVAYPGDDVMDRWVSSWDLTFDGGKKNDYNAGGIWARKGSNAYLRDRTKAQMRFTEQRRTVLRMAQKWPEVRRHLIEKKANGDAVLDTLRRPMAAHETRSDEDAIGLPGLVAVEPRGSKVARAEAASTYFETGNVFLPHPSMPGCEWVNDYINELCAFPTGDNDDEVDQTSQALMDLMRTSSATDDAYDAILPTAPGIPPPGRTGAGITDPREEQRALELAAKEAQEEERWKQRERERIAARLGLNIDPGAVFTTRR